MSKPNEFPEQDQSQPGDEHEMAPQPEIIRKNYQGSGKLENKIALITGGDSGIGRSAAVHFAREGADVAIVYMEEHEDARETADMIRSEGRECLLLTGDLKDPEFARAVVEKTVERFGDLNILVNNAAEQYPKDEPEEVDFEQVKRTFETNIFPMFVTVRAALNHLSDGDAIINTTSVTAYRGSSHLLDYSSTKGAITSYTRSLSRMLAERNIRVNGVAPGPIWTPLIPSTFDEVSDFGKKTPLGRAGQPSEVGPAYVYLAGPDSSYVTGQVIHINGGEIIGA